MKKVFITIKGKFATITEISKWDIDVLEDDITIGVELHYKWEDMDGNIQDGGRINDGEYLWEGNKIQIDSDGKVIMINGKTAEVELKKITMKAEKKKGLLEKLRTFIKDNKLSFKITDTDEEVKEKAEKFLKLQAFAKELNPKIEKFVEVTMADGTMAVIEPDIEVGAAIVIMDDEGNPVAAPVGNYELEDGRVIVVEEVGVIFEIQESIEEEVEDEEEELKEDTPDEKQKVKRIIESIVKEKVFTKTEDFNKIVEELKTEKKTTKFLQDENGKLVEQYAEVLDKFGKLQDMVLETFKELLDEPVKKPVVKSNNPLAKETKENIFHKPLIR